MSELEILVPITAQEQHHALEREQTRLAEESDFR